MIPKLWVEALNEEIRNSVNLTICDHNLIKNCQLYALDRLVSKELYSISLSSISEKHAPQNYFEKLLETTNLNLREIYTLLSKVSVDTNL